MQHLHSPVAVCEATMQHLRSVVAVCERIMQHLHSVVAVCETTMQHLHSVVAVCEMTMQHLHSVVAVCGAITQHLHSLFIVYEMITQGLHGLFTVCARPFSCPPGRRGGVCDTPLHVPGQTSLPREGPPLPRGQSFIPAGCLGGECNSPLHGYPAKLRYPRRGRPYMYPANFAGVRRRPHPPPQLLGIVNAWSPSLPLRPYF